MRAGEKGVFAKTPKSTARKSRADESSNWRPSSMENNSSPPPRTLPSRRRGGKETNTHEKYKERQEKLQQEKQQKAAEAAEAAAVAATAVAQPAAEPAAMDAEPQCAPTPERRSAPSGTWKRQAVEAAAHEAAGGESEDESEEEEEMTAAAAAAAATARVTGESRLKRRVGEIFGELTAAGEISANEAAARAIEQVVGAGRA